MSKVNEEKKEKCFIIMPISDQGDYPIGHFTKVYEQIIKPSVEEAGYEAYRVDENAICDTIMNKIFSAIQECPMAVCDLSNRNPNVLYELGLRQAYDKPVVLIQDDKTEKIFDVSGISTVFYKSARMYEDVIEARENIKKSILSTKEGKVSTLAKVMKINAADFSKVEVSQDDKTNIMLEGIYNEIKELKNRKQGNCTCSIISRNSNTLFNGLTEETKINLIIACEDFIKDKFVNKIIDNVDGITKVGMAEISKTTWHLVFDFTSREACKESISNIIEFANNLNIVTIEIGVM